MSWQLVVFASLNQAALVKRGLTREGIEVEMQRTPQSLSFTGCSFALRCRQEDVPRVAARCEELSIRPGGVFAETEAERNSQKRAFDVSELEQ
ncbi:MAG: DUF3343 domain-containing protein [Acidobacteriota bacterium]|nr:DUF3343 domain-containing protein [Acidobacteriota bacterium]